MPLYRHTLGELKVASDGTMVFSTSMKGVAACAADPFCKEHYQGGPGGHFFAPAPSDVERQANATRIAQAWNSFDQLVDSVREMTETLQELQTINDGPGELFDFHGMLQSARDALRLAGRML